MMKKGRVLSDTHFFARRSDSGVLEKEIYAVLPDCDVIVFNGDIFDFRWSTLPSLEQTIDASVGWMEKVLNMFPALGVKYVLGNHDCHQGFVAGLRRLAQQHAQFQVYEYYLQIGAAVFLHGDCANKMITFKGLKKSRSDWAKSKQWPAILAVCYQCCDRAGLTDFIHRITFPNHKIGQRIVYFLQTLPSGFPAGLKDIYFGHTHLPLTDFQWNNYTFHNSGSGIRGQKLNILSFTMDAASFEKGL